jgi:hypothetical protein
MSSRNSKQLVTSTELASKVIVKKHYKKPRLSDFGAMTDLTASGSGNAKESSAAGQPNKKP